jgi:hypothetical protein
MANYNIYLAQLPDEKQKHVRQCAKMLRIFLRKAEGRLTGYESENAEAETCSVIKTITDLKESIAVTEGMISELVDAHVLPDDDLWHVSDKDREDFREILTGKVSG